jgi:ORF6N domain
MRTRGAPRDPEAALVKAITLDRRILTIRGHKVILDADLAELYGITTKALNQAIKRNADRFPIDFSFLLNAEEKAEVVTNCDHLLPLKFSPVLPRAFTEHGAIMAATVLNSVRAVQMSVFVVRAFVKMRAVFSDTRELTRKLAALESELKSRLDVHEAAIVDVLQRIMKILDPPPPPPEPPPPEIGFHVKEDAVPYRIKRRRARCS